MSKAKEKVEKSIDDGFDWLELMVMAAFGKAISRAKKPETEETITSIVTMIQGGAHELKREVDSLEKNLDRLIQCENEIGFEESQELILQEVWEGIERLGSSLAKTYDLRQTDLFQAEEAMHWRKAAARKILQSIILKEIDIGKEALAVKPTVPATKKTPAKKRGEK